LIPSFLLSLGEVNDRALNMQKQMFDYSVYGEGRLHPVTYTGLTHKSTGYFLLRFKLRIHLIYSLIPNDRFISISMKNFITISDTLQSIVFYRYRVSDYSLQA
jgi:hypothetical protein